MTAAITTETIEPSHPLDLSQFTGHLIRLETFEGPLDLLLHLIKENQVAICDIPIARIIEQYLDYLALMEQLDIQVAGEFLVMAATLLLIKSRMLLPASPAADGEDEESLDPRAELVQRLLEYQQFKQASEELKAFSDQRALTFTRAHNGNGGHEEEPVLLMKTVSLFDLLLAFRDVLDRTTEEDTMALKRDTVTVAQKIRELAHLLRESPSGITFAHACQTCRRKIEVIVTFLALLELIRRGMVNIYQSALFGEIRVFAAAGSA